MQGNVKEQRFTISGRLKVFMRRMHDSARAHRLRPRPEDVFLVSYPRSGNTWLRFLIANMLRFEARAEVDFFSIREIVPDVHIRDQRSILDALPSPRLIKSHSQYNPDYPRVVYLVRDARDVYVSYYSYATQHGQFHGTFSEFLRAKHLPYGYWYKHVEGWLDPPRSVDLLLVQFEDLREDTYQELARVARFIGVDPSPAQLDYAIDRSSLVHMREMEEATGRPYGPPEFRFVRHGKTRGWVGVFEEEDKQIIKSRANNLLARLGYIDTLGW